MAGGLWEGALLAPEYATQGHHKQAHLYYPMLEAGLTRAQKQEQEEVDCILCQSIRNRSMLSSISKNWNAYKARFAACLREQQSR